MASLDRLKELLEKISKTSVPVRVEINYDGRTFKWRVPINNISAEEYVARAAEAPGHVDTGVHK